MPECVKASLFYKNADAARLRKIIDLAEDQRYIRDQLPKLGLCAFVANGSILPRESGVSSKPMRGAVKFQSPKEQEVTITLPHAGVISGMGIKRGANDYMEKPFHLQELEARVRSLTRRKFIQKNVCLECNGIRFDIRERVAYAEENPVALTRKENGILEYLLLNQGRPVSQEELIEHVWDASVDSFSGSIRVHMSSLRKKFKVVLGYDPIVNKIGEGYKLVEAVS